MVLNELGARLTGALQKLASADRVDEAALDEMLKEIGNALVASDVNIKLVMQLRNNIKSRANLQSAAAGLSRARIVREAVVAELENLLDPKVKPFVPKKGRTSVIMAVGLQGAGKTTTVTKLAYYYRQKGLKCGLVCADTFRAGAFAQLRQNATRARIPFFGKEDESDPSKVAAEGVEQFRKEGADVIIVDTSGRHKQEEELFVEMEEVEKAVQPDLVVFVMDGSIGQAAHDQALAFKERVPVGAVIMTKLDSHAKGGGALSAVAATQSPIIFLGTGERIPDLQEFDAKRFVQRLLGMGDLSGLAQAMNDTIPKDIQARMTERLMKGKITFRDFRDQLGYTLKMGPVDKLLEYIPGFSNLNLGNVDATRNLKRFINIMDSMTDDELDCKVTLTPSRVERIARGSGRSVMEVNALVEQLKMMEKMGKMRPNMKNGIPDLKNLGEIGNMLPPGMLQKVGGVNGLRNMMKEMSGKLPKFM